MSAEMWEPVLNFEVDYEVSNTGLVRRKTPGRGARAGHVLKPFVTRNGYQQVALRRDGRSISRLVCQLVCEAFHGPRPDGMEVRHLDGVSSHDHAANLRWGTHLENMQDVRLHGTHHNAAKSHCKNGHEFTPENTIAREGTKRRCRTCALVSSRKSKARARAAAA